MSQETLNDIHQDASLKPRLNLALALVCLNDIVTEFANPDFLAIRQVGRHKAMVFVGLVLLSKD